MNLSKMIELSELNFNFEMSTITKLILLFRFIES